MDDEILGEFLDEASELFENIDQMLVELEQSPENDKIINEIFRVIHSIKGTSSLFPLGRLTNLAHHTEDVLDAVRSNELTVTQDVFNVVFRAIDQTQKIIQDLTNTGKLPEGDDSGLIAELSSLLANEPESATADEKSGSQPESQAMPPLEIEQKPDQTSAPPETDTKVSANGEPNEAASKDTTVRVSLGLLDELMNLIGELVLARNRLVEIDKGVENSPYSSSIQEVNNVTSTLQDLVLKARMQPIGNSWSKLPRLVRDLKVLTGKKFSLEQTGREVELDRQIIQILNDPIVHCIRNCADHGLETPEERAKTPKPEQGTIRLSASQDGNFVVIEVADDGRGLDREKIAAKAISRGLTSADKTVHMPDKDVFSFLFEPGFSTAEQVTEISGRGVGLDVVRSNLEGVGGSISILSELGVGTTIRIKIPLTLAILSGLIVEVNDGDGVKQFAVPQMAVSELVKITPDNLDSIENIDGASVLRLREKLLPLISLRAVLGLEGHDQPDDFSVVVVSSDGRWFGIIVDQVINTQEIVIKPPGSKFEQLNLFTGTTILGNGAVIFILDVGKIGEKFLDDLNISEKQAQAVDEEDVDDSDGLVTFSTPAEPILALPLPTVVRLDEVVQSKVEEFNDHYLIEHAGQIVNLLPADRSIVVDHQSDRALPVIFTSDGRSMVGILVDKILDVAAPPERMEYMSAERFVGSCLINDKIVKVIDVHRLISDSLPEWFDRKTHQDTPGSGILVVDDSSFYVSLVKNVLEGAGYRVTTAGGPTEALKEVSTHTQPFDLIISDIEMPDLDGYQLVQKIKENPSYASCPSIALSSMSERRETRHALEAGFSRFLPKLDKDQLLATTAELVLSPEDLAVEDPPEHVVVAEDNDDDELIDHIVSFKVGSETAGIQALGIQEIIQQGDVATVPKAPADTCGVINLRGQIVTVIDLVGKLGLTRTGSDEMIIVVERKDELFGIKVGAIEDVFVPDTSFYEQVPASLGAEWRHMSREVYKNKKDLIIMLDVDRIVES